MKTASRHAATRHESGHKAGHTASTPRFVSRALACVAFVASGMLLSSCAAPVMIAAGPALGLAQYGTTTFVRGISTTVFAVESEQIIDATQRMITDLGLTIKADRVDKSTRYFRVEDDRGTEIKVWITRNTPKVTMLEIRVTFWGDEPYSSLILDQVKQRVGPQS